MANRYLKNKPNQAFHELAERLKESGAAEEITKKQLVEYFSHPIRIKKLTDGAKYVINRDLKKFGLTTIPSISGKTSIEKRAFAQSKAVNIKSGDDSADTTNPNLTQIADALKTVGKPIEIPKSELLGYYSGNVQINRLTAGIKKDICRARDGVRPYPYFA